MAKTKTSGRATAKVVNNPLMGGDSSEEENSGGDAREDLGNREVEDDVAMLIEGRCTDKLTTAIELSGVDESERTAADKLAGVTSGSTRLDRAKNRKRLANFRAPSDLGSVDGWQKALLSGDDEIASADSENYSPDKSRQLHQTSANTVDLEQERYDKMLMAEAWMRENWIVHPVGTFRKRWDATQVILLAYLTASVPYRIGFDHDTTTWEFWFVFDLLVDAYFSSDILLSFRTAFYNQQGDLEYYPGQIIKHYVGTWFLIDVAGSTPINYVVMLMEMDANSSNYKGNRFLRMMRLFRLLKLLRLFRMNRLLRKYEEAFYGVQSTMRLTKLAGTVAVFGHWLACVWWYFGTHEWIDPADVEYDPNSGYRIEPWTEHVFGPDVHNSTHIHQSSKYVTALYWSFMTMTTVGYGDIHARTMLEKSVSIVAMLVGGFVFGLMIGSLSDISRRANPAQKEAKKRIGWLSAYVRCLMSRGPRHSSLEIFALF